MTPEDIASSQATMLFVMFMEAQAPEFMGIEASAESPPSFG